MIDALTRAVACLVLLLIALLVAWGCLAVIHQMGALLA